MTTTITLDKGLLLTDLEDLIELVESIAGDDFVDYEAQEQAIALIEGLLNKVE
jgi:hypothetical protein